MLLAIVFNSDDIGDGHIDKVDGQRGGNHEMSAHHVKISILSTILSSIEMNTPKNMLKGMLIMSMVSTTKVK